MPLLISAGQHSDKGCKPSNQDFHGLLVPREPQLSTKGVAVALADGISSSDVSHIAAQAAVRTFLDDYYCTSDAWTVKTSAERVLAATNAWLYSQTQQGQGRFDKDRGHVCTFSALVIKSATAHIFHIGDTRVYQVQGRSLEQLTQDHRVQVSPGQSYLARALGIDSRLEIEYRSVAVSVGDTFVLATDGVHEHVPHEFVVEALRRHAQDLDAAAREIVAEALRRGSTDNLTVQLVRVDDLPSPEAGEMTRQLSQLPWPPELVPRMSFDGWRIVRQLHASARSQVWLAADEATGATVVIKTPATDVQADPAQRDRFLLEEWVARRIDSPHVLKASPPGRERRFQYVVMEYVEGTTLAQWMVDHPRPDVDSVRAIVDQVARALRAFHRLEMLHLDVRPHNVMIDATGTVKIIDFGATRVASLQEMTAAADGTPPGDAAYAAPEVLLEAEPTTRSDLFSLGVLAYQMLTGTLPYGLRAAQCRSRSDLNKLAYEPLQATRRDVPLWLDEALRKAVAPDPDKRFDDPTEFVHNLHRPSPEFLARRRAPLIERNPVRFWQGVSFALAVALLVSLALR